ncbi:hypothetical protein HPG69_019153 [Diceros bicornis minor]|uniref:GOLD domain-containing protein n=1 Tax=Diceros bicornis minor TaxID=77932 RepID=A0A7J7FM40_DICBM|nr:hypothetical protein HPG69_019153 [Diceros bicornis minor]
MPPQFQENIQDLLPALPNPDDYFLLRWLRARKFDLQKSEDMVRKHVEFRKQQDLDNILTWQPSEVIQLYDSGGLCGYDYEGCPVWFDLIGTLDPKGLLLSASKQDLIRKRTRVCELLMQQCELQSQKINHGGEVPKSYYLHNQVRPQYEHTATVARDSFLRVETEVLFPGCVLRWQFTSDGTDIGFGVFLKTKRGERQRAGEMTEVLPTRRYNAHQVPQDGSLTCDKAGVYVLLFDNTHSLRRPKKVSYTVDVLLPDKASEKKIEGLEATRPSPAQ